MTAIDRKLTQAERNALRSLADRIELLGFLTDEDRPEGDRKPEDSAEAIELCQSLHDGGGVFLPSCSARWQDSFRYE